MLVTHTTGRPWEAEETRRPAQEPGPTRGFRGSWGPRAGLATHTHGQRGSESPGPQRRFKGAFQGCCRGTLRPVGSGRWQGEQCHVVEPGVAGRPAC